MEILPYAVFNKEVEISRQINTGTLSDDGFI
jgi:hypothetical protein